MSLNERNKFRLKALQSLITRNENEEAPSMYETWDAIGIIYDMLEELNDQPEVVENQTTEPGNRNRG